MTRLDSSSSIPTQLTLKLKLFLALGVPLIFFLLIEFVCRILNLDSRLSPLGADMQLDMPTWMKNDQNTASRTANIIGNNKTIDWLSMFEEGPGFRVRLIPNIEKSVTNTFSQIEADKSLKYHVKANSVGFRGPEFSFQKAPGTFRIAIFGDSSSFGWGVNQNEYFTALLPQLLAGRNVAKFNKTEVLNFAIPGDSSEYGRLIFEHFIPPLEADLVILGFGANDAKRVPVPHTAQVESFRSNQTLQTVRYILSFSSLFRSLDALVTKLKTRSTKPDSKKKIAHKSAVNAKRYVTNLIAMSDRARESGIKNVLILNLCTPPDYAKRGRLAAETSKSLYLNGQAYLLSQIDNIKAGKVHPDLVQEMRAAYSADLDKNQSFYVTSDACHPNKLGQRMVAEQLAEIIAKSVE